MKNKYLSLLILPLFVLAIFSLFRFPVGAVSENGNGQEVCPNTGGGWIKVDGLSSTSYEYTAPSGKLVAEVCYKSSTTVNYYNVTPNNKKVLVESTVKNQNNQVQNLSHASFRLVDEIHPFVRITYICELPEDGKVEGWGVSGIAGDHLWRIRHEKSGPSTDFTLMAGNNIFAGITGHINTDQTLLYLTQDEFNGVSVKTNPLSNLYNGTASISGAICTMEEKYEECSSTVRVFGEWSAWVVDNEDETQEVRTRQAKAVDSQDSEVVCAGPVTLKEVREIEKDEDDKDDGEVLGTTDEVKDTTSDEAVLGVSTVVLAETGASDNILVYVVQAVLMLSTLISGTLFVKKYII